MKNKARVIPFTPAELMELHGLTVEDGLRAGYPVEATQKRIADGNVKVLLIRTDM